jgi:hypothetical protein
VSEFKLEFQGRLSRFLRGQGLDVDRITRYWIEYVPQEKRGRVCVTFLRSDGDEDVALLPADLEKLFEVL